MSKQTEALKLALEALEEISTLYMSLPKKGCMALAAIEEVLAQPEQEPVAYDKTEINCFAQDLYDQKMREGKHGHYESMFHVIHQCIKKVSPPASKPWVGLTDAERETLRSEADEADAGYRELIKATEAKLRKKNS